MAKRKSKMDELELLDKYLENKPSEKRMYSAVAYSVLLVFVGLPLWWKTTEVYRVSLPYAEIDALSEMDIKVQMNVHVVTLSESHGEYMTNELKNFFKNSKMFKINFKRHSVDKSIIGSSKSLEEIERKIKHPHFEGSLQLFEIPGLSRFVPENIVIGQHRTVYFSSDTIAVKLYNFLINEVLKEQLLLEIFTLVDMLKVTDVNFKHKMPPSDDFDILLTILNPDPDATYVQFDVKQAIQEYITPFLKNLEDMNGFHVKSQWLYFVPLMATPKFVNKTGEEIHYALPEGLLPHVITPLEKKLASQVSKHPCLNFVLYVPPCYTSPLKIYTAKGYPVGDVNAFISPRWGGIQIYNPRRDSCWENTTAVVTPEKERVMPVFINQLRLLLGISGASGSENKDTYFELWEKDYLLRVRTIEQLTTAKLTLLSLSKLLGQISNIVINDQVGEAIHSSLQNIYETRDALRNGKLFEAYNKSKSAFLSSEKAFTDPSLLALLYFPDDQKYAVYIPLFLPVMIPIIISFKQIKKWVGTKISEIQTPSSPKSKTD